MSRVRYAQLNAQLCYVLFGGSQMFGACAPVPASSPETFAPDPNIAGGGSVVGVQIGVAVIRRINTCPGGSGSHANCKDAERFATELFDRWGVGTPSCGNGVSPPSSPRSVPCALVPSFGIEASRPLFLFATPARCAASAGGLVFARLRRPLGPFLHP